MSCDTYTLRELNVEIFTLHKEFLLVGIGRDGLVLLLVVDVEADGRVGINAEPLLDHPPNPHDGLLVGGIRQPHGQLVSPPPETLRP